MKKWLLIGLMIFSFSLQAQESQFSIDKLLPAPVAGSFRMEGYWIWGASVVEADGMFHMYATRVPMSYKFHPGWMIAAEIVHAVSDKPEGPYRFSDIALERRGTQYWDGCSTYNPQIVRHHNKYYLYYGGTRHPYETPTDEQLTLSSKWCISSRFNKRIGVAIADSPFGPWKRSDKPVLDVEPNTFYSYLTSNPAPVVLPGGQVYMLFKGRSHTANGEYSRMQLGVAYADSPGSSFKVLNEKQPVFKLEGQGEAEDPFLWYEGDRFYTVIKDQVGDYTGERGAGVMAYSEDCLTWHLCQPPKAYSKKILWSDSTYTLQGNLERPFIFFKDNKPACIFFATMDGSGFNGKEARNIVIPISGKQTSSVVQPATKKEALHHIRLFYAERRNKETRILEDSVKKYTALLNDKGEFTDLIPKEKTIIQNHYATKEDKQPFISSLTQQALSRIRTIAESYGNKEMSASDTQLKTLFKAIRHYGRLETDRLNVASRWHTSCFAIPTISYQTYYSLFNLMTRIENGQVRDSLFIEGNKILGQLSLQSWTVPARMDETDKDVIDVERFRRHVWWVGGNATDYRPLLETAAQLSSPEMADVVGEIAVRSLSSVSQATIHDDFWQEGITADGAGWGHGRQCLVWGYPIDGTRGSLRILKIMKECRYPLPLEVKQEQIDVLKDYLRGSSYYFYKGYVPPVVDRGNMNRLIHPSTARKNGRPADYRRLIPSARIIEMLLKQYPDLLTPEVKEEFTLFLDNARRFRIDMPGKWNKYYSGSRYFFNNDDIIKKTDQYYVLINMASNRVSGLESANSMAAAFNIFTCDGTTLFSRNGYEHRKVMGAFNLRAWAGTTSRLSPIPLVPIENWKGYNSKHPFAAGATNGGSSFAGGFIFEKRDVGWPHDSISPYRDPNPSAFGIKAYKSYFMFDDLFLAIGCGIENKMPEQEGDIVTTIDQTELASDFEKGRAVRNNGFYYKVLKEYTQGEVILKHESKQTHWQSMSVANKLPETEEDIFHIYINHGRNPKDASYAYTVACNEASVGQTPRVLSNTRQVQAAESYNANKIGAVFYKEGTKVESSRGYFKVSSPCALLVEFMDNNKVSVSVTDGLMDTGLQEILIETSVPLQGEYVTKLSEGSYLIRMKVKTGHYTGSPVYSEFHLMSGFKNR